MPKIVLISIIASIIVGCTTLRPETVVTPSEISVPNALRSVGLGIVALKEELSKENITTGLLVDEVQLTLNLTSMATDSKALAVDISKTLASDTAGIGGKIFDLKSTETAQGNKGSVLIIKLKNAALVKFENPAERPSHTTLSVPSQSAKE